MEQQNLSREISLSRETCLLYTREGELVKVTCQGKLIFVCTGLNAKFMFVRETIVTIRLYTAKI